MVCIDFIEKLAVTIKDLGGNWKVAGTESAGRGEVFEDGDEEDKSDEADDKKGKGVFRVLASPGAGGFEFLADEL